MIETICKIESKFEIDGKEYFKLYDKKALQEYVIPLSQLFNDKIYIGSEYKFYKQYNPKSEKYFLTQEHPFYKLNKTYEFPITRIERNKENNSIDTFILSDNGSNEIRVNPLTWQFEEWTKDTLTCQVIDYSKRGLVLRNIDYSTLPYKIGEVYEFEISGFGQYINNKEQYIPSVILKHEGESEIHITALRWQTENLWKYSTVFCEVLKYNYKGLPHLKNRDERHPLFKIGEIYDFKVKGLKTKVDYNNVNKKYDVIELVGEDGFTHETNALPGQMRTLKANDNIQCIIQSIGFNLRLNQINIKDPYFSKIEEIVKDKILINKFFNRAMSNQDDEDSIELVAKYESNSAFWIFTFCNKILSRYFKEYSERFDYESSRQVAELIIIIENWIVENGIITSFPDEKARKNTLVKAKEQLRKYTKITEILVIVEKLKQSEFFERRPESIGKKDIEDLYFILLLSDIHLIDESMFFEYLSYLLDKIIINDENSYVLKRLDKSIQLNKKIYYNNEYENSFNLSFIDTNIFENESYKNRYFTFSFCQYLINEKLRNFERANYILGKILRQLFFSTHKSELREKLLYNAYFFQNSQVKVENLPLKYTDRLNLVEERLSINPNCCSQEEDNWLLIKDSLATKKLIKVRITQKEFNGYVVDFNGIKGFLSFNHIIERELKHYPYSKIDFTLTVQCVLLSEEFNFYIVKQPKADCNGYHFENNLSGRIQVGDIVEGEIKSIENYGIFITSYWGDGLLHVKNISTHKWNKENLSLYFKIGDNISTKILSIEGRKVSLSYKELVNTIGEDKYVDFINHVDLGYTFNKTEHNSISDDIAIDDIELKYTQLEKAFCFEQYAILKNSLDDKIHYLRLGKQFFSSINNPRSYLINIYTNYFNLLKLIEDAIDSFSIEKVEVIKCEAQIILAKVRSQEQTLEYYPESKKLVFFINIISLFNDQSESGISTLYDLLLKNSNQRILKAIAKITLANNLLISESDDYADFARRNLRHIKSYLDEGVLTLKENEIDKREQELREKIKYWSGRILEDESENQEFKSTFRTPLLDDYRMCEKEKYLRLLETSPNNESLIKKVSAIDGDLAVKAVIHSSLKALCAFANTNGGTLLIGVADDKSIIGLNNDYESHKTKKNRDGFGLFFDDKIKEYFEPSFSSLLRREFLKIKERDILIVTVKTSFDPVFILKGKEGERCEELYIRNLTSTKEIREKRDLVKFVKQKEKEQIKMKIDE